MPVKILDFILTVINKTARTYTYTEKYPQALTYKCRNSDNACWEMISYMISLMAQIIKIELYTCFLMHRRHFKHAYSSKSFENKSPNELRRLWWQLKIFLNSWIFVLLLLLWDYLFFLEIVSSTQTSNKFLLISVWLGFSKS